MVCKAILRQIPRNQISTAFYSFVLPTVSALQSQVAKHAEIACFTH